MNPGNLGLGYQSDETGIAEPMPHKDNNSDKLKSSLLEVLSYSPLPIQSPGKSYNPVKIIQST